MLALSPAMQCATALGIAALVCTLLDVKAVGQGFGPLWSESGFSQLRVRLSGWSQRACHAEADFQETRSRLAEADFQEACRHAEADFQEALLF